MKRFVLSIACSGVAALFVRATFTSLLVGIAVGAIAWRVPRWSPACNTVARQNEWYWFLIQATVVVAVFMVVWMKPDHGFIRYPSFVLRPSPALARACTSHTESARPPGEFVEQSGKELAGCVGVGSVQVADMLGRVVRALAAWMRVLNFALAIFITWIVLRTPPLRWAQRRVRAMT